MANIILSIRNSTVFDTTFKLCFVSFTVKGSNPAPSTTNSQSERRRSLNQSSAPFDTVLRWLSSLQLARNPESELTLNFSQTSGYRSVLPQDDLDLDTEADFLE